MRLVIDIEANGLVNPTKIWLIVCKDIDTDKIYKFRNLCDEPYDKAAFRALADEATLWIGHNLLGYDGPVIANLLGIDLRTVRCVDTLIVSKLVDYSRKDPEDNLKKKHSIEAYGEEFGLGKIDFSDFSKWSQELEDYCIRDVEINHKVFLKYKKQIEDPAWQPSIRLEHDFQLVVNDLEKNGFAFNTKKAKTLLAKVQSELDTLDKEILDAFPPREELIREFTPKATKFGTISKTSVPRALHGTISDYAVGYTYRHTRQVPFNPSSHKQLIEVLHEAGWRPVDKTKTHIEAERDRNRLRYAGRNLSQVELAEQSAILEDKLKVLSKTGWKINENNLQTLPDTAPPPAKLLAKRILLESRRRTLVEWLSLVHLKVSLKSETTTTIGGDKINVDASTISNRITDSLSKTTIEWLKNRGINASCAEENDLSSLITITPQGQPENYSVVAAIHALDGLSAIGIRSTVTSSRIHGHPYGIGAWTHRMAHQNPNTANIPTDVKLYGGEMRSLWCAPRNRLLVGVDAESIQLRIFAHYIDDKEFTDALVNGKKDDKSDPHSLNQRILGAKSRNIAKRFIFAYLLGAGLGKLAEILELGEEEARECLERLLDRYSGLSLLKETVIPVDAKRGYFQGLDGRLVKLPGDTASSRKHLCMSGYLQNGEAVVMKSACLEWQERLKEQKEYDKLLWMLVNFVHDEWQTEVNNDMDMAMFVAKTQADALRTVGERLKLKCPMAGSFWNDDAKDYTIGTNWKVTH